MWREMDNIEGETTVEGRWDTYVLNVIWLMNRYARFFRECYQKYIGKEHCNGIFPPSIWSILVITTRYKATLSTRYWMLTNFLSKNYHRARMFAGRTSTRRHIYHLGCDTWMAPIFNKAKSCILVQRSVRRGRRRQWKSKINIKQQMRTQSTLSITMMKGFTYPRTHWIMIWGYVTKATSLDQVIYVGWR